jgi:PLP dependent protein
LTVDPVPTLPPAPRVSLSERLAAVEQRVSAACARAGRARQDVQVLPVTKSVDAARAAELLELGLCNLAENRADELERKRAWFAERGLQARWHCIGHVQRNKARRIARACAEVHSVDSVALHDVLARVCEEEGRVLGLWLQVKLWPEPDKGGFSPSELRALVERGARSEAVSWLGLMTMAPLIADEHASRRAAREVFAGLRELAAALDPARFAAGRARLSMGMSSDFELAVEAGADVVRIGSALFSDASSSG